MSEKKGRIKVLPEGPYQVSGNIPLSKWTIVCDEKGYSHHWEESMKYPDQEQYLLCRCGQSRNKPFCDGTHTQIEWDSRETARRGKYMEQAKLLRGPDLELTDYIRLCSKARFCERAKGIWKLTKKSNDPEARAIAIEEAGNCPSGRLVVWDKATGLPIEPDFEPSLVIVEDPEAKVSGPIWVRGGIPVEGTDGTEYEVRNRVTLCRCGRSENKPFCDATHVLVGFTDEP
jgi:CDGSH-type Zn-finger protein